MASGTINGNTVQGVWRAYAKWSDSTTNDSMTLSLTTGMQSIAWGIQISGFYADASINNSTASTTSTSFSSGTGATVSKDLVIKSVTITRTHVAQTIAAHASIVNSTGYKNGTSEIYTSWTVPAKPSWTVSFNANGGTGAPGAQTKWYGETLALSATKPTRAGYSFQGWATSSTGAVAYAAGASYTGNAALTLYAVWKADTYAVKYDANGGTGAPAAQTKTHGVALTLSSTKPTRANYTFKGWATAANAATVSYAAGASYTANAAVTLYAVWELAYTAPRVTSLAADRCTSTGAASESGTYAKVTFSWATDKAVSGVTVAVNGKTTTVSATGTSGSVSQVVGAGALATETAYVVTVTVKDASGTTTVTTSVAPMSYAIDFLNGGKGVAFGKPASASGYVDSAWIVRGTRVIATSGTSSPSTGELGMRWIGTNVTGGSANDTRAFWAGKGTCYAYFSSTGQLVGQPSQYGFVISYVNGSEIHQEWWTQSSGAHFRRGCNSSATAMPSWTKFYDANTLTFGTGLKLSGTSLSVDSGAYVSLKTWGSSGYVKYARFGKIVVVNVDYAPIATAKSTISVGTLPTGFRPPMGVLGTGYVRGADSYGQITVNTDGAVQLWCSIASSASDGAGYFGGSLSFYAA